MSDKLINAFLNREKKYKEYTEKIFNVMPHITEGITEYLETTKDYMRWEGVDVTDEYLMIHVKELKLKQEQVQIYTIGIPIELAEAGTKDDVIAFLKVNDERNTIGEDFDDGSYIDDDYFADDADVVSHSNSKRVLH